MVIKSTPNNQYSIYSHVLKDIIKKHVKVFLAGSIEMGSAEKWQDKVINYFDTPKEKDFNNRYIEIFNPRRDDWDSSWNGNLQNSNFVYQVNWEINNIEESDIVFMYFDKDTKSPITLLELGYIISLNSEKLIVCCPDGFWRRGNVEVMCTRKNIPLYNNIDEALLALNSKIDNLTI